MSTWNYSLAKYVRTFTNGRDAIVSSSRNAKMILKQAGLIDCFNAISDGSNISNSKPHPEVFLKAAEFIGLSPGVCFVVEDALAGIEAGKRAGCITVAIGDAARTDAANYMIDGFSELLEIVN
jgi:beta-phosphoglucomutase